jgi:hypothetical protein
LSSPAYGYYQRMTKLLEQAIELASALPSDSQDEIARAILHLVAGEADAEPVDASHLPAVLQGLAQSKRREFATDAEVEAAFRRFDR